MAYTKQPVQAGDIMDPAWGNHIQTQYEEAVTTMNGGQIVEEGSNVNGEYIRYENGMQLCWFRTTETGITPTQTTIQGLTLYRHIGRIWTFPATFISTPTVMINANLQGPVFDRSLAYDTDNTRTFYLCEALDVFNEISQLDVFAIGKWK